MTGAQIAAAAATQRNVFPRAGARQRATDLGFRLLMYGALAIACLALATLLFDVARDGLPALSPEFLTNFPSRLFPERSGIQSALVGTLYLMVLTALLVVPLGVATAVYLEEYADQKRWYNRLVEVNIQNLAAVPSVVYGILGLAFVVRGPLSLGNVLMAGAITLSLLVLPVVIIVAREAIRAVPPSIREASMALGATQWQTIYKHVLPGAVAGIATGVILALSRAIGETAPLLVIGAAANPLFNPRGVNDQFTALPIQIFTWTQQADKAFVSLAAATILVLMAVLLVMNSFAIYLRNRYEQKW